MVMVRCGAWLIAVLGVCAGVGDELACVVAGVAVADGLGVAAGC